MLCCQIVIGRKRRCFSARLTLFSLPAEKNTKQNAAYAPEAAGAALLESYSKEMS